jgi:lipoate-protein ligase A
MALDEAILEARSRDLVPNTLRFLQFRPRCTLVGYHQAVEQEVRVDYCRVHGIEINRRITGGGALFWDESQLGWEIYAPIDHPRLPRRLEDLYACLCQGTVRGLERLGVRAAFRPENDIEVDGRKISGTGGTEMSGALLFQGTLLVDFDVDTMLRALRIPIEKLKDKEVASVKERVTCLAWELGQSPPLSRIKTALAEGFAEVLGVEFVPGPLTEAEGHLLAEKLPRFRSEAWVYGVRRHLADRRELRALYKAPGGLIRASLAVDASARRIKMALLTGDFFAYPRRAIFDLESRLKDAPAEPEAVRHIVESFFAAQDVRMPGVTPDDVVHTLHEALARLDFGRLGVDLAEANHLFTVLKPLAEMPRPSHLLLPYCAKPSSCEYRYREGCVRCGLCDVGEAYALAEAYDLTPITIQNYEKLEEVLTHCRRQGAPAFVGSCCETFFAKHRADFERLGLPGVLVDLDSSTCYDLGREQQAYRGQYENQTKLRLGLLRRVVTRMVEKGT